MRTSSELETSPVLMVGEKLINDKPPILVEVRYPKMGTSSDWFLCVDAAGVEDIYDRLGPGTEVHLNSAWDLKNPAGAVVFLKTKQSHFEPHHDSDREDAERLFDEKPPVLVEVRFPKMGTSSDWFLCEDAVELDAILDRRGPGTEVHLNSAWDLKNPAGAIVIRKGEQASARKPLRSSPLKRYELPRGYEARQSGSVAPPAGGQAKRPLEYMEC